MLKTETPARLVRAFTKLSANDMGRSKLAARAKRLLAEGADVNLPADSDGWTALLNS